MKRLEKNVSFLLGQRDRVYIHTGSTKEVASNPWKRVSYPRSHFWSVVKIKTAKADPGISDLGQRSSVTGPVHGLPFQPLLETRAPTPELDYVLTHCVQPLSVMYTPFSSNQTIPFKSVCTASNSSSPTTPTQTRCQRLVS